MLLKHFLEVVPFWEQVEVYTIEDVHCYYKGSLSDAMEVLNYTFIISHTVESVHSSVDGKGDAVLVIEVMHL